VVALLVLNGPLSRWRLLVLLLAAPTVAFSVNALRVTLLALLPVQAQAGVVVESPAFRFWHEGGGSTLFALVAVSLLMALEHQMRSWRPSLLG
jgi:exosortase/archaeosortase family protein